MHTAHVLNPSRSRKEAMAWLFACCWLMMATIAEAGAGTTPPPAYVTHGGYLLGRNDRVIASHQPDTPLVPASIWKIATALHALSVLGKEYRFETRCYYGPDQTLYVQGSGDPMLTSEEVTLMASRLRAAGVRQVQGIVIDDSAFALASAADGATNTLNPYDVANSGLAVNFNTIHITKAADGSIRSAEPQTPTLPIMLRLGKWLPAGTHRINISQKKGEIGQYAGELMAEALRGQGIAVTGPILTGTVPTGLPPVVRHSSTTGLGETVRAMLEYSNNFIANQLFLACGAKRYGYPATWDKGRKAMSTFLHEQVGLDLGSYTVEEGSGLSRKNQVTPRAMLAILRVFMPHAALMPMRDGMMVKTGTLRGVYNYAGYFQGVQGPDPFVLMLNQPENHRDQLLRYLEDLRQSH